MEESLQKFMEFVYFLIDLIKDLVAGVSGKETKKTDDTTAAE